MDKLSYDVFYNKGFFLQAFGIYGRGCLSNTTKLVLLNYLIFHLVGPNKYSQQSPNIQSSQGVYLERSSNPAKLAYYYSMDNLYCQMYGY